MSKFRGNPWAVLLVISLGFFMTLLDLTIVNIAIPNMISKLHAGLDEILWVINGYALVLAVLLITSGRLGDLRGPRNVFILGITVFTVASAACGLAATPAELIGFRVVQGLGAALLMPQTLAILTMVFPPERRGAAFGIWGAVAGVATIAGPTLGGLLVTAFDWRWIFFVNLPIGAAVLALSFILIPDVRPGRRHRLDVAGVLLASAALFAICYGLVEGQRYNWGKISSFLSIPLILAVGVAALIVFVVVEKLMQGGEPLVPFAVFRDRNFSVMNVVSAALAVGMLGIFLPFTIYLQSALGMSALRAGLTLAPASVISVCLAPWVGRLADRLGGKYFLMTGLVLFGGGMAWATMTALPGSRWYDFLPALLVAGVGMGCIFAPMSTVAMRDVQPRLAGAAAGLLTTNRQVGSVIGTAAVGALLQNRLAAALVTEAGRRASQVPAPARGGFVQSFRGAAKSGLQVGSGQGGGTGRLPNGTPPLVGLHIRQLGHDVFTHAFVAAMRPTTALPIAVIAIAALGCFAIKNGKTAPQRAPKPSEAHGPATGTGGSQPEIHGRMAEVDGPIAQARSRKPGTDGSLSDIHGPVGQAHTAVAGTHGPRAQAHDRMAGAHGQRTEARSRLNRTKEPARDR